MLPPTTATGLSNPFFQGGLSLMVAGLIVAALRDTPRHLWHLITRGFWLECHIDGTDAAFYWVNQWLSLRPEVQTSNMIRVESRWYDDDRGSRNERRSTLIPGVGDHLVKFEGAKFWLSVTKEDKPAFKTGGNPTHGGDDYLKPYSLKIRCRKQHRALLVRLLADADAISSQPDLTKTRVYLPDYQQWMLRSVQNVRKAESVVLAADVYEELLKDLRRFDAAKAYYETLGVPYRYGRLLHGPPGNGKSSLVLALAGILGRDLYVLPMGNQELDDSRLLTLMASIPPKSIVLMEDIDAIFKGRERQAQNKLTFSGVLNAIDGALASEGRMLFVTANVVTALDSALVRPGRCDDHTELRNATPEQAARLYLRFFPAAPSGKLFGAWAGDGHHSMATLQGHLLRYQGNAIRAAEPPTSETKASRVGLEANPLQLTFQP